MTRWMLGVPLSWWISGGAMAQPAPPPPPVVLGPPEAPPPVVVVPAAPPVTPVADATPALRPGGLAIGIGVGYLFPTSLQTPNVTSVRLRLASGLTFEPTVVLAATSISMPVGSNTQGELTLGSLVRYPLRARGAIDLEAVGSVAISNHTVDPDGDHNNRTTTTFDLGYGVALAYWLTAHWSLSLTATNTLLSVDRTHQEAGAANTTTNRTVTGGLVFDPQVAVMIHLYD
jgi:hypothetical protein